MVDTDSLAVFANRAWAAMSGMSPQESLGAGWHLALDEASREAIADGVESPACRPCEVKVRRPASPDLRPVWLFMAAVTGFDGRALGKVLWGPVPDPAAPGTSGLADDDVELYSLDPLDRTDGEFVARLQVALDEHRHASTTLAVLVVEIRSVPARSSAVPVPDEGPEEPLGRALMDRVEVLVVPPRTVGRLGPQMVAILCPEVATYREAIDLAEQLVGLAEPCSAQTRRGCRALVTVGVAFPHLPGADAESLLRHAIEASAVARTQGRSGFEVVIGTGPGSSDVTATRPEPLQEHLSVSSGDLQARAPT